MNLTEAEFQMYTKIINEELIPAMGCTEPIAIAYASAKARQVLGKKADSILVECSANILKNANGVTVPNSGSVRGVKGAAILGAIGGQAGKKLQVLMDVKKADIQETKELLTGNYCRVKLLESPKKLHIIVIVKSAKDRVRVELVNSHDNIVKITKNEDIIRDKTVEKSHEHEMAKIKDSMTIKKIVEFAREVDLSGVEGVIERQINMNTKISREGLENDYGLNVGSTIRELENDSVKTRAKARAAAASDARMSGSILPVVINSGSGNQGITVSLPVIEYARYLNVKQKKLLRALVISNLISLHIKSKIGILSAYCGAVSAAAGCGGAITFLYEGDYGDISRTVINTLGNVSGILCDGAKPSCAAKIASSVDAAILGHNLTMSDKHLNPGEGIIQKDIEATIDLIGKIGRDDMEQIDKTILRVMTD